MKKTIYITVILIFGFALFPAFSQDMRENYLVVEKKKQALMEKAKQEAEQARQEAKDRHQQIISNRQTLKKAVSDLETHNADLKKEIAGFEARIMELKKEEETLQASLSETQAVNKELSGFIRGNAKDLNSLLNQSFQSALKIDQGAFLQPMINNTEFQSMDDIRHMVDVLFEEINLSGAVRSTDSIVVDRNGREIQSKILLLGNFTAVYKQKNETGFLLYSDESHRFFALSKLPARRIVKKNQAYMKGKADSVYMDISKGAALRQLTHEISLMEQIPKGGPIVWPILAILAVAIVIIIERIIFLRRKHVDAEGFTQAVCAQASNGDWDQCLKLCQVNTNRSIPHVLKSGINCREMDRIDMENALQESILSEIPSLERFMSTLGMLAAIAPLLGLLGTVTGMINTFHVITYYGTGDPRMMSGGISEALVTTMLGLSVAIPIMLAHTLLSRKIETEIGLMEEKAVSFVNTIFKTRIAG